MEKVYFVSAPGRIKIGFTRQPEKRLIELRRVDMDELSVIAVIDGPRALEKKLHHLLADHRLRGEWFVDCSEVRLVIDEAIAGKHKIEPPVTVTPPADMPPVFSPEFQIIQRLFDETEAALDRKADKYEIRGRAQSLLAAVEQLLSQPRFLHLADPPR